MSNCPKCKAPVLSERMLFHRCETTGYVDSGPTIWNSESARRLARYDEAVLAKVAELEETLSHVPMGMRR